MPSGMHIFPIDVSMFVTIETIFYKQMHVKMAPWLAIAARFYLSILTNQIQEFWSKHRYSPLHFICFFNSFNLTNFKMVHCSSVGVHCCPSYIYIYTPIQSFICGNQYRLWNLHSQFKLGLKNLNHSICRSSCNKNSCGESRCALPLLVNTQVCSHVKG